MMTELIDTSEALGVLLSSVDGEPQVCALDTEADSLHRYRESLCLIQFAIGDTCVLIDPLAIEDLSPLGRYLAGAEVWMHGADYDMTMLKRQFGSLPPAVFDTQIGARLLGARRFGLADLVKDFFDIELSKSSQKADWGKRPLTAKMVAYALNDVRFLLPMGGQIVARLRERGRYGWFVESCEAARLRVLGRDDEPKDEQWRIRGCSRFEPKALACLRALWEWRDAEARKWDRPSFMVVGNPHLLEWAVQLAQGQPVTLPKHFRPDRVKRFHEMREALRALPEDQWPARVKGVRRKRDKDFDARVEKIIKRRDQVAAELDIEGSLIVSRSVAETLADGRMEPAEALLGWQRELLGLWK